MGALPFWLSSQTQDTIAIVNVATSLDHRCLLQTLFRRLFVNSKASSLASSGSCQVERLVILGGCALNRDFESMTRESTSSHGSVMERGALKLASDSCGRTCRQAVSQRNNQSCVCRVATLRVGLTVCLIFHYSSGSDVVSVGSTQASSTSHSPLFTFCSPGQLRFVCLCWRWSALICSWSAG